MSELRDADVPFWVIILCVVGVLFCLLFCCTRFVRRCFTPENHLGPETEANSAGKRWIRPPDTINPCFALESDRDPREPLKGGAVGSRIYENRQPKCVTAPITVEVDAVPNSQ
jgi:hypothetical protein